MIVRNDHAGFADCHRMARAADCTATVTPSGGFIGTARSARADYLIRGASAGLKSSLRRDHLALLKDDPS